MYNSFHLILGALLASSISAAVSNILWIRHHRRVVSLLERDLRDLWEEIDTLEEMDEPPRVLTPEEQEAERQIRHFREHPEDYNVAFEESDGGLYVTVSLKDPEGGEGDA